LARDTTRLSPTLDVEHHHVRFLGDLVLNLWDCGGQDAFYESYFERDRETIFRGVELLIYVFDIESETPEKDFDHFCGVLEAIEENSPDARIFLLIHKMDLVAEEDREAILEDRKRLIEESCISCGVENFQCFGTSIWDETLYKAWSEIVTNLIPNIRLLENHLNKFCRICDADEVVLFERATFLVISHAQGTSDDGLLEEAGPRHGGMGSLAATPPSSLTDKVGATGDPGMMEDIASNGGGAAGGGEDTGSEMVATSMDAMTASASSMGGLGGFPASGHPPSEIPAFDVDSAAVTPMPSHAGTPRHHSRTPHFDAHRFEKISNIIKQFKLSCGKAQSQFEGMQVQNSRFTAYIDQFTANTYIMVRVLVERYCPF
jgi:Gtr1/RagA G protein conserved region